MIQSTKNLLKQTRLIINHQKEVEKLKGESFNVFSILKMEKMETKTHTPFLAELLNPDGKHFKGNLFLQLFLETIGYYDLENITPLNVKTASVKPNHYIGPVITENGKESGGNLDIYIQADKQSITIENKIDENTEQEKQVVRYCNYNNPYNTVFYLTPFGTNPSSYSKGALECGVDYHCISYKTHIISWLQKCLKESAEQPILRETIRQYILLIQKITYSMDNKQDDELNKLMLQNFEEATFISNNFFPLKKRIYENTKQSIITILSEKLGNEFKIYAGDNAQIWIKYKKYEGSNLFFGSEFFNESSNTVFIGVFNMGGKPTLYDAGEKSERPWWPYNLTLPPFEGYEITFSNSNILSKLYEDKEFNSRFVLHIVAEIIKFIDIHKQPLLAFLDKTALL
ncbi:PD-(D/E)XK nuclease family protein [Parasediminibacterium sp. JCM 36343]|uniref:PDDEXK-like family protein n=1 Tax=Parasediminibacterium sp. JCM 36343 TaxID=3374279 RepID=UPI0039798D5B